MFIQSVLASCRILVLYSIIFLYASSHGIKILVAEDNPKVTGFESRSKQKELKVALGIITKENYVRYEKLSHLNALKHEKGDPLDFLTTQRNPPPPP